MSFQLLVKRLTPKLKAIAFRLNHNHTFFDEEDLFQEALVHLWLEFKADTLADKTDSYVLQGCYFYLKNYIRCAKDKVRPLSIDGHAHEDTENSEGVFAIRDEASEHYFDRLHDTLLAEAIRNNGLTAREKQLLPLFAEGLTTRAIGKRLGISHVAVIKMRNQIRRKCLRHLDKE